MKKPKVTCIKHFVCLFVLCAILCMQLLVACNENKLPAFSTAEKSSATVTKPSVPEKESTKIEVDGLFIAEAIDKNDITTISNCIRYESNKDVDIFHVLFTPKSTISNVALYEISNEFDGGIILGSTLFEEPAVSPQKPFLADIEIPDAAAVNCLGFTDEKGNRRYFKITNSEKDGGLIVTSTRIASFTYENTLLPEKTSYNLLFLGNSATYVNDIPANLAEVCAAKGITINQTQIVPGGSYLEQHANNVEVFAEIAKGYDAVFLQENGNAMTSEAACQRSLYAIEKIGKAVHESGAKFYFYVRPPYGVNLAGIRNVDQCELFDDHFTPAAEKYKASCVYVNRAFAYAIKNCGSDLWGSDNAHTNERGAYLAVCTFYSTLFGKSATELDILFDLPEDEALELQKAADKIALEGIIPWQ